MSDWAAVAVVAIVLGAVLIMFAMSLITYCMLDPGGRSKPVKIFKKNKIKNKKGEGSFRDPCKMWRGGATLSIWPSGSG
ncbi:hypothetical protein BGX38DRAFT_1160270 [Terfezia claveryi]|nr:hypothetical protein BGX38DRAFT_1160270 [Terfezia claveryi]